MEVDTATYKAGCRDIGQPDLRIVLGFEGSKLSAVLSGVWHVKHENQGPFSDCAGSSLWRCLPGGVGFSI